MQYQLTNKNISLQVSSKGAQMQSIDKDGVEYLWQGDEIYWEDRSPLLFPYVGRLTEGKYRYKEKEYKMEIHGFAREKELSLVKQDRNSLTLELNDDNQTRDIYPFQFRLWVTYELIENTIKITYDVKNLSPETMYFGIGGHPGFQVPLEEGLTFSDYYLEFSKEHYPERIGHTSACFLSGINKDFVLQENKKLVLSHKLFDEDAIVLQHVADQVTLKSDKGKRSVTVSYPELPYLGLWHKPKTEAPYICIEPWTSLPSRQGIIEDIQFKQDLIRLHTQDTYQNEWFITVG